MYIQFLYFQCSSRIDKVFSVVLIHTLTGKFKLKGFRIKTATVKNRASLLSVCLQFSFYCSLQFNLQSFICIFI